MQIKDRYHRIGHDLRCSIMDGQQVITAVLPWSQIDILLCLVINYGVGGGGGLRKNSKIVLEISNLRFISSDISLFKKSNWEKWVY